MTNVVIIHGMDGKPDENWFQYIRQELAKRGYEVFVPQMPSGKSQTFADWDKAFGEYAKYLDEDSILIAHSMGVPFALTILEKKKRPIKGAFFVAGFVGPLGDAKADATRESFAEKEFDFQAIKKKCEKFFLYGSDDDPYVPLEKVRQLGEKLDVEPIIVEGAGHFNTASGYTDFEDLLIDIISLENN